MCRVKRVVGSAQNGEDRHDDTNPAATNSLHEEAFCAGTKVSGLFILSALPPAVVSSGVCCQFRYRYSTRTVREQGRLFTFLNINLFRPIPPISHLNPFVRFRYTSTLFGMGPRATTVR